MIVRFPSVAGGLPNIRWEKRYYQTYYRFIRNLLEDQGVTFKNMGDTSVADGAFAIWLNDDKIVIDYSDHLENFWDEFRSPKAGQVRNIGQVATFKFHYSKGYHEHYKGLYPISPISFYYWNQNSPNIKGYWPLQAQINYSPNGSPWVISRQRPFGNARTRRHVLQNLLVEEYGLNARIKEVGQIEFWKEAGDCLTAVFAPGSRNDMLDRGHIQYLAFGCCVISPRIINILPYDKELIPDEHYIMCRTDYADVVDKVEWISKNKEAGKTIGDNAKQFFQDTCTPKNVLNWMKECIEHGKSDCE